MQFPIRARGNALEMITDYANWDYLCKKAAQDYSTLKGTDVTCEVDRTKFANYGQPRAFDIFYSDGIVGVVKIYSFPYSGIRDDILTELAAMKLVRLRTNIPVPEILSFESDTKNPFGFAYAIITKLPGRKLDTTIINLPEGPRFKVAKELARIVSQLSSVTFPSIGRPYCGYDLSETPTITRFPFVWGSQKQYIGPFISSMTYVRCLVQVMEDDMKISAHMPLERKEYSVWFDVIQENTPLLMSHKLINGPFPLANPNLDFTGLLFDDDYNITGVLGWDQTKAIPAEEFCSYLGAIIPGPANCNRDNQPFMELRCVFVKALKELQGLAVESPKADDVGRMKREAKSDMAIKSMEGVNTSLPIASIFQTIIPELIYFFLAEDFPFDPESATAYATFFMQMVHGLEIDLSRVGDKQLVRRSIADEELESMDKVKEMWREYEYQDRAQAMVMAWRDISGDWYTEDEYSED